ncbi:hypothetical protein [Sulfodiicoccus acidiphilus]|nr:hypothetical protein [Sulfodiicoccus acidiphilus]
MTETVLDCFVTWATTLEKLKKEGKLKDVEEVLGSTAEGLPQSRDEKGSK